MATTPTSNPIPSEAPQDLKFNAGKLDEFVTSQGWTYTDRFGVNRYTIEGMNYLAKQAMAAFGYIPIDSFQAAATITLPNQVLRDTSTGEYYRWDGSLPKNVPANSTPASSGGTGTGKWLSVGDTVLRSQLAAEGGAAMIGTSSGDTVQDSLSDINGAMYQDPLTKWANGGTLKIKQGEYNVTSSLVMDYGLFPAKFIGTSGVRTHYEGENMAETIFNCTAPTFAMQMKGDNTGSSQRIHTYDYLGGFTLKGNNPDAYGLLVQGKAYTKLENIVAMDFAGKEGIRLENVLTSNLNNIYSQFNGIGIRVVGMNPNGSDLNAVSFDRVTASYNTTYGIYGERWGACNVINGLTCEGNGTMGNGSAGGIFLNIQGNITVPAVVFNAPYFELNKGGADLRINNASATKPLTVIINSGLFNRAGSTDFTKTNIAVGSFGGKKTVILIGTAFANSAGYVPSVDRPYWSTGANCEVIPIGCVYDDETAQSVCAQSMVMAGKVTAAGGIVSASTGLVAAKTGTGIYTISYINGTLGNTADSFSVVASPFNPTSDGISVEIQSLSRTSFRVNTRNVSGAAIDCGFSFMISRIV